MIAAEGSRDPRLSTIFPPEGFTKFGPGTRCGSKSLCGSYHGAAKESRLKDRELGLGQAIVVEHCSSRHFKRLKVEPRGLDFCLFPKIPYPKTSQLNQGVGEGTLSVGCSHLQ